MGLAADSSSEFSLNQFPGLMVPGGGIHNYTRTFLRFNHDTGYFDANSHPQQLHVPHGHVCRGSAYGWLFLIDEELNTKLLNPFSTEEIQLPSASTLPPASRKFNSLDKWYVDKSVFSSNPSLKTTPPVVLVIHSGHTPRLAYCKPGDKTWTSLHSPDLKHYYMDVIFYNDQFYALNHPGCIVAYDIGRRVDDDDHSVKVTQIAPAPSGLIYLEDMYLVEVDGELIKLTRKTKCDKDDDDDQNYDIDAYGVYKFYTYGFEMQEFDSSEEKWMNVESLGDKALFLGFNTSFTVSASEFPGCIPNSIYFTNGTGGCEAAEDEGHDMGIYNLTDKSIKLLYPINDDSELTKPSPIWVADANALKIETVATRHSRL